jgi:hypothetical protein
MVLFRFVSNSYISVDASKGATFWVGNSEWGTHHREKFSIPALSEQFSESSARSSGNATQVLWHWHMDTFEEMPQVATLSSKAVARYVKYPSRTNRRF